MAPPGLTALGAKGSACDRLRLTGGLRAFALGRYIVPLRWEGGRPFGRQHKCRLWRRKPDSRASPVGKPYNRPAGVGNAFPLWWLAPPPFPRKRGHYKAPLCCERLMKGMLRGVLFCPLHRGKSGAARIGGGERSEPISRMLIMPYDTERQIP